VRDIDYGTYDVVVLEADDIGDDTLALSLLITSGDLRGEIVCVNAHRWGVSWVDALGAPATLTIAGGRPHVVLD